MKLPSMSIVGKARVEIPQALPEVFDFVALKFFENYPKWTLEISAFEPLDGIATVVGAKARQVRVEQGKAIASIIEITDCQPYEKLSFKSITQPYRDTYLFASAGTGTATELTFIFELLEVELFMRPFEKLVRTAIEEGAETTVNNIKNLVLENNLKNDDKETAAAEPAVSFLAKIRKLFGVDS